MKMALKFCSNLSFMFQEEAKIIDRYQLARNAGFKAVETGFPLGFTVQEVVDAKELANVQQVLINVYTGDTTKGELGFTAVPGKEEEFKSSIEQTIKYAKALDCNKIHVMAGKVENPTHKNDAVYESNLRYAASRFETENIMGLIEPINDITVPNYYMNNFQKALNIIQKINSPRLKLLMDIFHLQLTTGRITNTIEQYLPYIGHIQVAQVPDRNEPDTVGEIDYKYVFSLLEKHGYNDYIGLEYKPRTSSSDGLMWIKSFGYNL
ncbi:putative hydroxypyruvate isomerase [Copidosoma floridanum]|uniref:putative hydroxypyruvate isomerase n=1 Tax=Copidosoma floridanum TaxID=29053 RepID=UPI0006C9648D|nr:putative hydroxypyruvate isomerase [Copidosoma floridanum]XP_014217684.1 putative hydroxypyruvate isomerase [Copidosoma floridanum]